MKYDDNRVAKLTGKRRDMEPLGGRLEVTRRYGPLRRPTFSSCGELQPSTKAFLALQEKKGLIMLFWPIFGVQ